MNLYGHTLPAVRGKGFSFPHERALSQKVPEMPLPQQQYGEAVDLEEVKSIAE